MSRARMTPVPKGTIFELDVRQKKFLEEQLELLAEDGRRPDEAKFAELHRELNAVYVARPVALDKVSSYSRTKYRELRGAVLAAKREPAFALA